MDTNTKMPVLFIGHGSPMNALVSNDYTRALNDLPKTFPTPKAIVVISAHWMTKGTYITAMSQPKTIHDFYGFPPELFAVQYPAPGSPELAENIIKELSPLTIFADKGEWGLDHGTWAILKHMYPEATIPVLQISMDRDQSVDFHFELGKKLHFLRNLGVLIIGSGNIVHNLHKIDWNISAPAHHWAIDFDQWVKQTAISGDFHSLVNDFYKSEIGKLSHPTIEHYLPLLYVLGAVDKKDQLSFPYEGMEHASLSMRSFQWI